MNNTQTKKFKTDLKDLYQITDGILKRLKTEELSKVREELLIGELIEISEELVLNNCKRFIREKGVTEITQDELYITATSIALWKAIKGFDINKGVNFLIYWEMIQKSCFINDFAQATNKANKFYSSSVCSSDVGIDENDNTIMEYVEDTNNSLDVAINKVVINDLINAFEKIDKHGKLIRCEMIIKPELRTEAMLKVLGINKEDFKNEEAYKRAKATARKTAERTRLKFKDFLLQNGFSYEDCL